MAETTTVGFLGLGLMGSRMAARIGAGGFSLRVWNRDRSKADAFAAQGATVCTTAAECVQGCDIVLVSLANDSASRDVLLGDGGALQAMTPGSILVETSTLSLPMAKEIADAAQKRGVPFLDCPVSGSTPQAEAGTLVLLAGGDADVVERARPVLSCMGQTIIPLGKSGSGAAMKLVVNSLLGLHLEALGEVLALGKGAGLDVNMMLDALSQTAHVSAGQKAKMPNVRAGVYPPQFPLRLLDKDFGLALQTAADGAVSVPMIAAARQAWASAKAAHGDDDCSYVVQNAIDKAAF